MPVISTAFRTTSTRAASVMLELSQSLREDAAAASCCAFCRRTFSQASHLSKPSPVREDRGDRHFVHKDTAHRGHAQSRGSAERVSLQPPAMCVLSSFSHVLSTDQLEAVSQPLCPSP